MQVPRPTSDLWNQNPHFNKMSCQRGDNMDGLGVWKQSLQTEMADWPGAMEQEGCLQASGPQGQEGG